MPNRLFIGYMKKKKGKLTLVEFAFFLFEA
jgi:hypothetical protein